MARPLKNGLDYFSFDINFFSDKKIKRLKAKYGEKGVLTYIYILCVIYDNGYYADYDEDLILDISDEFNISEDCTRQIMNYLFSRSLLDGTLAESVKVLTSTSIQRRYQKAVEKRAKKRGSESIEVEEKFWVLKTEETESFIKVRPENVFPENNTCFSEKNDNNSQKKYTKKSKVKESKGNNYYYNKQTSEAGCTYSEEIKTIFELYKNICISFPDLTNKEKYIPNLEALMNQYKLDEFELVFKKLETNSFFKGNNKQNWKAAFGWTIKPENFKKILSGFYDNRNSDSSASDDSVEKYKVVINKF